jgi:hypothetical protein
MADDPIKDKPVKIVRGVYTKDHLTVPKSLNDPVTWQKFGRFQLSYSRWGLGVALVCIIGGIILALLGVTGSVSWTAKAFGVQSKLSDAAPGVVLFLVGLFIIWATRFSIEVR